MKIMQLQEALQLPLWPVFQGDGQKPPKSASQAARKNAWNVKQCGKFFISLWRFEKTAVECGWDTPLKFNILPGK